MKVPLYPRDLRPPFDLLTQISFTPACWMSKKLNNAAVNIDYLPIVVMTVME